MIVIFQGNTANRQDIHVNLRNEINKNFDGKGRFRGAAIAVNTVNSMTKDTYSNRSNCCKYVQPNSKKRKVVFKEALLFDLTHSDSDLQHFSVYGECSSGKHQDISFKQWNSLNTDCSAKAPERYRSSPEILSPTEKKRHFYDAQSNQSRQSEEARQFKEHLSIEESKQDEKSRSALELRHVEQRQEPTKVSKDGKESQGKLKYSKAGKADIEVQDDSFSRFGRTRKQVFRQKGARRPRSSSFRDKKDERSRKRSYDIPLHNREGHQVKKYSVPDIEQTQVSLENFIERDIVFSMAVLQGEHVSSNGNLSSFEQLEASIEAENNDVSSSQGGRKKVSEIASEFEKLSLDGGDQMLTAEESC